MHIVGYLKFTMCYNHICFDGFNHFKDDSGSVSYTLLKLWKVMHKIAMKSSPIYKL